jgi:hypothetical protein
VSYNRRRDEFLPESFASNGDAFFPRSKKIDKVGSAMFQRYKPTVERTFGRATLEESFSDDLFLSKLIDRYTPGVIRPAVQSYTKDKQGSLQLRPRLDTNGQELSMATHTSKDQELDQVHTDGLDLHKDILRYFANDQKGLPPLYIVVVKVGGAAHASLYIIYNYVLYSMGFGYSLKEEVNSYVEQAGTTLGFGQGTIGNLNAFAKTLGKPFQINRAAIMSPDYLIKPTGTTKSKDTLRYKIVDAGILRDYHVERIRKSLKQLYRPNDKKELNTDVYTWTWGDRQLGYSIYHLDAAYSRISNPTLVKFFGTVVNCTSLLEYIFEETLRCSLTVFGPELISNPGSCKTTRAERPHGRDLHKFILEYLDTMSTGTDMLTPQGLEVLAGHSARNVRLRRS